MDITIFRLSDYSDYMNGDPFASDRFQHFSGLTWDQYKLIKDLVEQSEDHDWR